MAAIWNNKDIQKFVMFHGADISDIVVLKFIPADFVRNVAAAKDQDSFLLGAAVIPTGELSVFYPF